MAMNLSALPTLASSDHAEHMKVHAGESIKARAGVENYWLRLRRGFVLLALRYPRLVAGLMFMFLFTVAQKVDLVAQTYVVSSPFWQMILMGVLVGFFGAIPTYELIQKHRQLAQVEFVRAVVTTLHHELNNPLTVIIGSAALMCSAGDSDGLCREILTSGKRIRDVMAKLNNLDKQITMRTDPGFLGAIDLDRSQ